jgi:UDP-GlcNAc:undecaprenyl-phosphate GlcNAc-1-phosphate transferase
VGAVLAALAVGFVAGRLAWLAARQWFIQPGLLRPNYRNHYVPTATGIVLALALLLVEAGRSAAATFGLGDDSAAQGARLLTLLAVLGFCLLGTVDDVAGSGEHRGFRGHLLALATGRVTTGLFKLLGGAAVALVVVGPMAGDSPRRLFTDAALIALSANLGNLLDRRPGRTAKAALACFVLLVALAGAEPELTGVAVLIGAAAALLVDDLRERLMLGDAGANPLGAALGLGVVLAAGPEARDVTALVVLVLNLLGEVVSFTRVIDAVPPLRALDRLGRPARPAGGPRRPGSRAGG